MFNLPAKDGLLASPLRSLVASSVVSKIELVLIQSSALLALVMALALVATTLFCSILGYKGLSLIVATKVYGSSWKA